MNRRDYLKLLTSAGVVLATSGVKQEAHAASETDRFWVMINAQGGWDPTLLCDPKGNVLGEDGKAPNTYSPSMIRSAGNLRYAPYTAAGDTGIYDSFFQRYAKELLVINGIETFTSNHDTGLRYVWSGSGTAKLPSLAALIAACKAPTAALSYVTYGGYDYCADLPVAGTRSGDPKTFVSLAYPNRTWVDDTTTLQESAVFDSVMAAHNARLQRQIEAENLPSARSAFIRLFNNRNGENGLDRFGAALPPTLDASANRLRQHSQVVVAAFKAGLSVSANLNLGGFDTHANHDASHYPQMANLLDGIDFLLQEAEAQGIRDRITVVVGSDFARSPFYNANGGKDHWSATSMMMLGPGIRGSRVIGATDDDQRPLTINPNTLAVDPNGVTLTPEIVHRALRKLAGIDAEKWTAQYPVDPGAGINLFS